MLVALSCGEKKKEEKGKFLVAAAANVQYALVDLVKAFEQETGIATEVVVSSTGKLTAQVIQGAPYAILLAANMKYPDTLIVLEKAMPPNRVYALGSLVLWTTRDIDLSGGMAVLDHLEARDKLAVANPRNAPYGAAAINALVKMKKLEGLRAQLIFGESIAQTNQYILSGAAAMGMTARSVVLSPQMENRGKWISVPDTLYQPVQQGVVVTKYGWQYHEAAATAFLNYLLSEKGQQILKRYGYQIPK